MQKIHAKQVANYVLLPGVLPRIKDLFGSGSGMLAFLIAQIFHGARLLPAGHPYVNPVNIRKFNIRQVFAEAGNRLVFDRHHIDQIAIFTILMTGFVLFVLQFALLAFSFIVSHAHAAVIFDTTNNTTDIAFELLDRVFGIPNIFNSCVAQFMPCGNQPALLVFPTPFNAALQKLFQYYSTGLFAVAVLVFIYYIVVVVMETAQTGTPFGKRFAHIWAPIRLVAAIGLLLPVSYGLNSAQYIVLYAAKMGSGFATNGWLLFNSTVAGAATSCTSSTNSMGVCDESLYARPKTPDSWPITKFMLMAATCRDAYAKLGITDIKPYLVKQPAQNADAMSTVYSDALDFYNKSDVIIRFGKDGYTDNTGTAKSYKADLGGVRAFCGEVTITTTVAVNDLSLIGPFSVQDHYYQMIKFLWANNATKDFSNVMINKSEAVATSCTSADILSGFPVQYSSSGQCSGVGLDFLTAVQQQAQVAFDAGVQAARTTMVAASGGVSTDPAVLARGWAGAGIWYNKLAESNGAFFGAVAFMPTPTLLPIPMEEILEARKGNDQNIDPKDMFNQERANNNAINWGDKADQDVAKVLNTAYRTISDDDNMSNSSVTKKGNIFEDAINLLFGAGGLFSMRENTDIHPLAQLVGLGKGIIDATIRNLFTASVFSLGGGFLSAMPGGSGVGGFLNIASQVLVTVAGISMSIGFMLYYMLPFLPFMYFFFAVGSWVKTIFEAMVGVPLWALGHLRIDGHGLPGESAIHGYYMIFEIFARPILCVLGLIGGMVTFTALAKVLNEVFKIVTDNLAGFGEASTLCVPDGSGGCVAAPAATITDMQSFKRGVIDQFFFTIIYTIIVYMMATSSFKMIDLIPKHVLRWMGNGAQVFSSQIDDPERGMGKYFVVGAQQMTSQVAQGMQSSSNLAGQALAAASQGGVAASRVAGAPAAPAPGTTPPPAK